MLASTVLVVLPPSVHQAATQVVIASSEPVLAGALGSVDRGMSLAMLRSRIQVKTLASNVISISAQGKTAVQAESTANAVASSYVAYLGSGRLPGRPVQAQALQPATNAKGTPLAVDLLVTGGLGALFGFLAGVIVALAMSRSDRRLRERDEIADSIGAPVLASVPVGRPSDAAGWTRLLTRTTSPEPSMRGACARPSSISGSGTTGDGSSASVGVVSLSSDRNALALGPQLAVFAAAGDPHGLVIGPHRTRTLRPRCAPRVLAPSAAARRSGSLRVTLGAIATTVAGCQDRADRRRRRRRRSFRGSATRCVPPRRCLASRQARRLPSSWPVSRPAPPRTAVTLPESSSRIRIRPTTPLAVSRSWRTSAAENADCA